MKGWKNSYWWEKYREIGKEEDRLYLVREGFIG